RSNLGSGRYGLRASRAPVQNAGVDREDPPRDFATARRDRLGTDYDRPSAEAFVAYRTIRQSHCKGGKSSLNLQGGGVALARAAHRRQTPFPSDPCWGEPMDKPFPIVGVGASAGGVEALEYLFKAMPPEPGMAFVIVTHLAPKRESMLPEILARDTRMPVLIA